MVGKMFFLYLIYIFVILLIYNFFYFYNIYIVVNNKNHLEIIHSLYFKIKFKFRNLIFLY